LVELIKYKLRGTILEPMIALMIIMFSITSAFTIVMKANNHNNIHQIARADASADEVLFNTIRDKKYLDEELKLQGLTIEKSVEWYDKPNHLLRVIINVYDNKNKILATRQRVIISYDTNAK
jgi:hypothetical protein